jgi:hypothetical protein
MEAHKLSVVSMASAITTVPMSEINETGQLISIVVAIISGLVSLYKHFKKRK